MRSTYYWHLCRAGANPYASVQYSAIAKLCKMLKESEPGLHVTHMQLEQYSNYAIIIVQSCKGSQKKGSVSYLWLLQYTSSRSNATKMMKQLDLSNLLLDRESAGYMWEWGDISNKWPHAKTKTKECWMLSILFLCLRLPPKAWSAPKIKIRQKEVDKCALQTITYTIKNWT